MKEEWDILANRIPVGIFFLEVALKVYLDKKRCAALYHSLQVYSNGGMILRIILHWIPPKGENQDICSDMRGFLASKKHSLAAQKNRLEFLYYMSRKGLLSLYVLFSQWRYQAGIWQFVLLYVMRRYAPKFWEKQFSRVLSHDLHREKKAYKLKRSTVFGSPV